MDNATTLIDQWFEENTPGINPKNTAVLFYVSFKGCHDTEWREYKDSRSVTLEDAEKIASSDGRMFTLRKVHIGEVIISLWEMKEERDTIKCIYRNDKLFDFFWGKNFEGLWR